MCIGRRENYPSGPADYEGRQDPEGGPLSLLSRRRTGCRQVCDPGPNRSGTCARCGGTGSKKADEPTCSRPDDDPAAMQTHKLHPAPRIPGFSSEAERGRLSPSAIKTIVLISQCSQITDEETVALLGPSTDGEWFYEVKQAPDKALRCAC